MIRPASEISAISTEIPQDFTNALRIGNQLLVAKAGASSVFV